MRRSLLSMGVFLALVSSSEADWPHVRGPAYDGVSNETGVADTWPAEGPPRLWARGLGQGYSGFVVAEGRVYTQRQTLAGQFLLCLDPETGQTLWEQRYDWPWQPKGAYPGPYASPTWYQGKVYYASPSGLVGCVDAHTGAALWSRNVRDDFQGKGTDFGYAATPLVEAGRVFLPVGGPSASMVALDADDGQTVWAAGADPASYCPAFPFTFQGRRCVAGYLQNAFVIHDLATGKLLHRQALSSGYDEHSAWPLYREPYLLLTAPFRSAATCLRLEQGPDDAIVCRPHWSSRELCNDILSSVLYRDHVYGFDLHQQQASKHRTSRGTFRCLDWSTGKVCWSTDQVGHASVLVADGKLLLVNDTGSLILVRADPMEYHELARTQLFADDEICWTPPTLWQGRLFVRSPSQAMCVYVGHPEKAPAIVSSTVPAARGWRVDASWLLCREREYPNDAPSWDEMTLWFSVCVFVVFGGAALGTTLVRFAGKAIFRRQWSKLSPFWAFVFVLGFLGANVMSALADRCLFTWPASLYAVFHVTVQVCVWAAERPLRQRVGWLARLAVVGFLLVGYGYFELCQRIGMFVAWYFLVGFLPAFPFTFLAVRGERKHWPIWVRAVWTFFAFTMFFWSAQALFLWKAARTT